MNQRHPRLQSIVPTALFVLCLAPVCEAVVHHSIGGIVSYRSGPTGSDGFDGASFAIDMTFPENAICDQSLPVDMGGYAYVDGTYEPLTATLTLSNTAGHAHDGVFDLTTAPTVSSPQLFVRRFTNNAGLFSDSLSYRIDLAAAGVLNDSWSMNFAVVFGRGSFADTSLFHYGASDYQAVSGGLGVPGTPTDYILIDGTASAVPEPVGPAALAVILAASLVRRPSCGSRRNRL